MLALCDATSPRTAPSPRAGGRSSGPQSSAVGGELYSVEAAINPTRLAVFVTADALDAHLLRTVLPLLAQSVSAAGCARAIAESERGTVGHVLVPARWLPSSVGMATLVEASIHAYETARMTAETWVLQIQSGCVRDGALMAVTAMQGREGPAEPVLHSLASAQSAASVRCHAGSPAAPPEAARPPKPAGGFLRPRRGEHTQHARLRLRGGGRSQPQSAGRGVAGGLGGQRGAWPGGE